MGDGQKNENDGIHKEGALIWLAHIHDLSLERMTELGLDQVSAAAIWEAVQMWCFLEKRDNVKDLQAWFNKLYDTMFFKIDLDVATAQQLAFPCQVFDHAAGFTRVTKYLAYHHHGTIKGLKIKDMKLSTQQLAGLDFVGTYSFLCNI